MTDRTDSPLTLWDHPTLAFLSSQAWHPAGAPLLLAVSGGADSMALFHWARRSAHTAGCRLVVAHVQHGLPGGGDRLLRAGS